MYSSDYEGLLDGREEKDQKQWQCCHYKRSFNKVMRQAEEAVNWQVKVSATQGSSQSCTELFTGKGSTTSRLQDGYVLVVCRSVEPLK